MTKKLVSCRLNMKIIILRNWENILYLLKLIASIILADF